MQKLKELRPELFRPVSALKDPHQNVVIKNIRRGNFDMPINVVIPPPTKPTKPTIQREPQLKIVVDSFSTPDQEQEQEQKQDEPIIQPIVLDKQPDDADIVQPEQAQPEEVEDADIVQPQTKRQPRKANPALTTRKIRTTNKDIANTSVKNYVKFGSVDVSLRLPRAEKEFKMAARPMYMNNRKMFIGLINNMFKEHRDVALDVRQNVSCEDLKNSDSSISLLTHQRVIRDYMNLITPYRGLLLYHGLGAGKTCSSIAIAEGFKTDRGVLIMTPASLNPNYMEELKKCGDEYYKKQQFWEWVEVMSDNIPLRDTLSTILQLPKEYIEKNNGAWVVDITKPSNYDTLKRRGESDRNINDNQTNLNNQLNEMIAAKYSFINYNGISTAKYNEMRTNKRNPFDNRVVVIDEAHNLVSRIVNQLNALYAGKQVKLTGTRKPMPLAINIYTDLMSAVNARIVLLSGTPIINYPNEIAVLFNILRGYIKTYEFVLSSSRRITLESIKRHLADLSMLDYIEYNHQTYVLTITTNPFGFDSDRGGHGVIFNPSSENMKDPQLIARITDILKQNSISVEGKGAIHTFTALPDSLEEFMKEFIKNQENNMYEFNNPMKFKKRIIGLTSYFRSAQEELLPRYSKADDFKIVRVSMSDFQFAQYEAERFEERKKEQKLKKGKKGATAPKKDAGGKEMQIESSSTFKIYSRLLCNFATPSGLIRPKPAKRVIEEDMSPEDVETIDVVGEAEAAEEMDDTYKQDLQDFINVISEDVSRLTGEGLATNSPKLLEALNNITSTANDGLHLVYSQFRTYEGIEIFTRILNANGFARFKIKQDRRGWVVNIEPEDLDKPKYALYTGTEGPEEREILRNIYNGSWKNVPKTISDVLMPISDTNNMGQHIKVLMITAAGSEGINLFNTRFVHLIDPYWNNVRLEQVVGRARRICSHQSLPFEKQTVTVFLYLSVLTEEQWQSSEDLMHYDVSKLDDKRYFSSDETLYEIACIKEHLNTKLLHAVKEASIDCATHRNSSLQESLKCLSFGDLQDPTAFSYLPDIKKDVSDEVYKQNVEVINIKDFQEITRRRDGLKFVKQESTGLMYTYDSFLMAKQTKNIGDLIVFTE